MVSFPFCADRPRHGQSNTSPDRDGPCRSQLPIVSDVLKHPAFPTATWHLEPTRAGLLPVAEGRGGPLKISWAIHGHGPVKMIVCAHLMPPFLSSFSPKAPSGI